jgi:predicted DNA-binding protein with PD1-like motif
MHQPQDTKKRLTVMAVGQVGRICIFRLLEDEDLLEAIEDRIKENSIKAGTFTLIGALKNVVMGCYKNGEYVYTRLNDHMEIASCMGNIAVDDKSDIIIHSHLVVSNEKGEAFGGHLMKGSHVGPTAELMILEASGMVLQRALDEKTKLKLLKLG